YLAFNGCTNFGGYTWVTVASTSCSSDATGQSSGMAGLLYSAARNAVDLGVIEPSPTGRPISAEEAKQLLRLAADDVDFSTPRCGEGPNGASGCGPANNFATTLPASQRFVTTAGWDQIFGWGRLNIDRAVRMVAAGLIPPEADLTAPRWWEVLPTAGEVEVVGRVAAPRASSYTYEVQFAPGVQPPRWPAEDTWTTVATGSGTEPFEGVLATLDMAEVRRAIDLAVPPYTPADDPTSRDLPEKDAFRVRVVVSDDRPETGDAIEQRQFFSVDLAAQGVLPEWPRFLEADGAGSPAFADLDGNGVDELVIADGNGFVHAFRADGTEAPGWPVHTGAIPLPASGDNAFTRSEVPGTVYAPVLLGSPAVADLDGDGGLEVAVADIEGFLHVWHPDGSAAAGFPVRGNPAFTDEPGCQEVRPACDDFAPHDVRDRFNTVDPAFTANPSVGDLDPGTPGLELVAGSNDGHVYAWHADGSPAAGWPVLLRDPAKVAAVDPVTHRVTYAPGADALPGRKVLTTPTLGDVDGDGDLEVAVSVNEQYDEPANWSGARDPSLEVLAPLGTMGNTRVYLLHHDGTAHPETDATLASAHPDDQAYVEGWPVPIGMLVTDLLPYVGEGSDGAPVMADVDGDGTLEIATASIASPPYLLRADGSSFYGNGPEGDFLTMASTASEYKSAATDAPSFASLGGGAFGRLGGDGSPVSFAMGASALRRLLDVLLPEQQLGAEDHLGVWDAATGTYQAGFPAQMNDLMFFNTPAIADVTGDGLAEVIQSSAMYDLRAYGLGGVAPPGWPKFTGGWSVSTPGLGDLDGDGKLEVALMTREGLLFVWRTEGVACDPAALQWPGYQHDLANTGNYETEVALPASC
ncbi:MAG: VCBS repeat-containing protein, partial [Actinobacteria bacterium]|nr:VCBS repeat-containing protein [Actinomycetota bacterium]